MMLFIFGGLPAVGKSELAAYIAEKFSAVFLRIDTIEQSMRDAGYVLNGPEGYMVAYAVARDNLRMGKDVVCDSVNPIEITRQAWRSVAADTDAPFCEIEVICSDRQEHKKRVGSRRSDIPGLLLPGWEAVLQREYEKWDSADIIIDTAGRRPEESRNELASALAYYNLSR